MYRQIVLDTETTGIRIEEGHRIIEIGCVEMIDRKLTGNHFHHYVNPEREIDRGALAVHGITSDFLQDKPLFKQIADEFIAFIKDAELIIHNASFDLSFLNNEIILSRLAIKPIDDYCRVIDTLQLARQLHVGQRNNLDALCKRYGVDTSKRDLHGALLDANLLAQVYLAMTGGQGSFFDSPVESETLVAEQAALTVDIPLRKHHLSVLRANEQELIEHEAYLEKMQQKGKCLWRPN